MKTLIKANKSRLGTQPYHFEIDESIREEIYFEVSNLSSTKVKSISADAEWYNAPFPEESHKRISFLTKQYTLNFDSEETLDICLWDKEYELPTDTQGCLVIPCDVNKVYIDDVFKLLDIALPKQMNVYIYYAPPDLWGMLSKNCFDTSIMEGTLNKKRNISGYIEHAGCRFKVKDLIGAFNSSLENAFECTGYNTSSKVLASKADKEDFRVMMREDPNKFLTYAIGDSRDLLPLWTLRVSQLNEIVRECLGIEMNWTVDSCPRSSGSLVSTVFNRFLAEWNPQVITAVNVLSTVTKDDFGIYQHFRRTLKNWDGESDFVWKDGVLDITKPDGIFCTSNDKQHSVEGLASASIRAFGALQHTGSFNAIVMGGRCNNEAPHQAIISDVFDIDLNSCYGTALREFNFPIGRPRVFGLAQDCKPVKLGEFLKVYRKDGLVDNLYQIIVKGKLKHQQDIVFSKVGITEASIKSDLSKAVDAVVDDEANELETLGWEREVDRAHIKGDFILLRQEIENGIITSDVLKVIEAAASNQELKEWMNLDVIAAAWYDKRDLLTPEQLFKKLKTNAGNIRIVDGNRVDERTFAWSYVSLEEFIGKFITYRKSIKKQVVEKNDTFDLKQNGVKLFINTTYGDFAAPYFAMGNTVLANNITAKARIGTWMLAKGLGLVQSITDGGAYSNNSVRYLNPEKFQGKKPSINTLADYRRLNEHRSITTGKLFEDFSEVYSSLVAGDKNTERLLDDRALEQVNAFWSHYGLELPFTIEHKYSNTCKKMTYLNASDYAFIEPVKADKGERIGDVPYNIKVRGAREYNHPKKLVLLWMAGLCDKPEVSFEYEQLVGFNQYKEELKRNRIDSYIPMAGETLIKTTVLRPNANFLPKFDLPDYKRRQKVNSQRLRRHTDLSYFGWMKEFGDTFEPDRWEYSVTKYG
jgi:hypothetical protein